MLDIAFHLKILSQMFVCGRGVKSFYLGEGYYVEVDNSHADMDMTLGKESFCKPSDISLILLKNLLLAFLCIHNYVHIFQFKAKHNRKGPWEFGQLKLIQDLGDHTVCRT